MKLQKFMASVGIDSRRNCEKLIAKGLCEINGNIAKTGDVVNLGDNVRYKGKEYIVSENQDDRVYLIMNKPLGVVTTVHDEKDRKTIIDCLPKEVEKRVFPVGRLDVNTTGIIILTNDGELTNKLTHPRFQVSKTYRAKIFGKAEESELEILRNGIVLEDGLTLPAKIKIVEYSDKNTIVDITIKEGRNRQVRRMFEEINHRVLELCRIKIGRLELSDLGRGKVRELTPNEVDYLKSLAQ